MANTTTTAGLNGKAPRKSLADQLDRLDCVIDDLSEGLNETVADVVRQAVATAVQQAVEGLLQAVLQNPEPLRALAAQLAPPAAPVATPAPAQADPAQPGRLAGLLGRVRGWLAARLRGVGAACAAVRRRVGSGLAAVRRRLELVRRFRGPLLTAAGVGLVAGTLAYFSGPWLAAAAGRVGGFLATLALQAGRAWRRLLAVPIPEGV